MIGTMHSILRTPRLTWATTTVTPSLVAIITILIAKPALAISLTAAAAALLVAGLLNRRKLTKLATAPGWGIGLITFSLLAHGLALAAASTSEWSLTMLTISAGSLICASAMASTWIVPGVHTPAVRLATVTLALFATAVIFLGIDRALHSQLLLGSGATTIGALLFISCGTVLIQHQPKMNICYGVLMLGAGNLIGYLGHTTWHTINFTNTTTLTCGAILAIALAIAQRFNNPIALTGISIGAMLLPLVMPLAAGATLVAVIFLLVAGAGLCLESVNIIKEAMNSKTWAAITGSHRIITSTGSQPTAPIKPARHATSRTSNTAAAMPPQAFESPLSGRTPRAAKSTPRHASQPQPAPMTRKERRRQEQLGKRSR